MVVRASKPQDIDISSFSNLLLPNFPKTKAECWSIGGILHSIKSYSAKQIPQVMNHIGKVWQDGRFDRMVRNKKELEIIWEYIRQNPVKAELAKKPEEYPFLWEMF